MARRIRKRADVVSAVSPSKKEEFDYVGYHPGMDEFVKMRDSVPKEIDDYFFCHTQGVHGLLEYELRKLGVPSDKAKTPSGHYYFRVLRNHLDLLETTGFSYSSIGWSIPLRHKNGGETLCTFHRGMALDFMWEKFQWETVYALPSAGQTRRRRRVDA